MEEKRVTKTPEQIRIGGMVRGYYDTQKLRIAMGQRILVQMLAKLGLLPIMPEKMDETKEEVLERRRLNKERTSSINAFLDTLAINKKGGRGDEESKKPTDFMDAILTDYKSITDFVTQKHGNVQEALKAAGYKGRVISDQSELEILNAYNMLVGSEMELLKPLARAVEAHPLWSRFLVNVRGVGPLMAAVIISEFDINKANYASSFIKYSGFDTVIELDPETGDPIPEMDADGNPLVDNEGNPVYVRKGRSRKVAHREPIKYIDRKGNEATRVGLTYNPFLKTKLAGVLGASFLKASEPTGEIDPDTGKKIRRPNHYAQVYYDYKNRISNMAEHKGKTAAHIHAMANRYMIKCFLIDLFTAWCLITDRIPPKPYHEGKLGMEPHSVPCPYIQNLLAESDRKSA